MDKYQLGTNINFVILEDYVVVLDFKTGEFYLLTKEYIHIFNLLKNNKEIKSSPELVSSINNLLECNILEEV